MKYGLAVDVEILHQTGEFLEYFPGNILLLSLLDEENNLAPRHLGNNISKLNYKWGNVCVKRIGGSQWLK